MSKQDELASEQKYFDAAWDARERRRKTLGEAAGQAAGPRAAVSEIKKGADRELANLGGPDDPVAFGRFDLIDGEAIYIGRHLINDEAKNALVINWKVDFAGPYFAATYDDPCGIRMRRKFLTERNTVLDFEGVVFDELANRVGALSGLEQVGLDDTVLRDLDKHRTGEMQDIVQTIHASQYQLVRSPLEQLLIIQGGPGTGKTAVALHRVSWLLFNHLGELQPEDVLVVGPNPTFTKYIRSVLPGLGDNEVTHRDLLTLGPQATSRRAEDAQTARLKGDARMADLVTRALRQRIRVPERMDGLDLGKGERLTGADLEDVLKRFANMAYARGRGAARWHLGELAERRTGGNVDAGLIDNALERIWPSLTPQAFLRDLLGSRERLVAAAGDDFTAGDVSRLLRGPSERIAEETWTDADVALLDEAEALINGESTTYAHLVVDEAQDLSPMQLRSLRRRSRNGSMTVVGDLAQSTGPWARDSWDEVGEALLRDHPVVVQELMLGYRVPNQVFELAVQLLPEAAPNIVPPRVIRHGPADPHLEQVDVDDVVPQAISLAKEHAGQGRFVGVVCPDSLRDELIQTLQRKGVAFSDASKGGIGKSINLVSPVEAKGLEFDAVVVLEPERIAAEYDRGLRMLYVAFTRTTQYLAVVHSGRVLPLTATHEPVVDFLPPPVEDVPAGEPVEQVGDDLRSSKPEQESRRGRDAVETVVAERAQSLPPDRSTSSSFPTSSKATSAASATPRVPVSDLGALMAAAAAAALAESIRASVPESLWPRLIDQLRQELGVAADQVRNLLQ